MTNHQITDILNLTAKLSDLHGADPQRAKNYNNLAFQIDKLMEPIFSWNEEQIKNIQGVGPRNLNTIVEIIETKSTQQLTELLAETPFGVLELLKIKGCGPKKVATIWKEMGILEPAELMYACNENRLILYKGFGEKIQQSILEATQFYLDSKGKYLPPKVAYLANQLEKYFTKQLKWKAQLVGDLPRQMEVINTIEIIVIQTTANIVATLDPKYFSDIEIIDPKKIELKAYGIKLTLILCDESNFSKIIFEKNCSALFYEDFKKKYHLDGNSELEIFSNNNLPFIPAYLREYLVVECLNLLENKIITTQDVKGVIHNHSTYSDGAATLLQMAEACIELGYQYLIISDHSQYASYANGLPYERILQQHKEIDALNIALAPFKIFKSIECDILPDGSLDYSPSVLNTFDLVIASIHSVMQMSLERAMERIQKAIENPYTSILGHPTGRLLLGRNGYPIDWEEIIHLCAQNNVVLELNANPRRLDIDWRWIPKALKNNILISINPDAHSTEGIKDIQYGVLAAQKAGLTKEQNLSSHSLQEIEIFIQKQKEKRPILVS
jgi:DNA polymerase (family X)